jgi:hypothetical protein
MGFGIGVSRFEDEVYLGVGLGDYQTEVRAGRFQGGLAQRAAEFRQVTGQILVGPL